MPRSGADQARLFLLQVGAQVWDNVPMMETKSGGNYVIWPVVWQALTNAGLESVDVEEVHPHCSTSRTHSLMSCNLVHASFLTE